MVLTELSARDATPRTFHNNRRRASVGVARIHLIEHIVECLPILYLGVQTV
jgi:hypothetical protein